MDATPVLQRHGIIISLRQMLTSGAAAATLTPHNRHSHPQPNDTCDMQPISSGRASYA
jgi:hypothetical protein